MFTGLIEGTGTVQSIDTDPSRGGRVQIGELPWSDPVTLGESIAVNGTCLTAIADSVGSFQADVSVETLKRTNLSTLRTGDLVNLERPLRIGDRLGGHLVQGHVDGIGKTVEIEKSGDYWTLWVELPKDLSRYVVEKGSITVDGISLTVAALEEDRFSVALIPKTWEITNLSRRKVGDAVNLEVDVIAKYVERMIFGEKKESKISKKFLEDHGYL
ncbi:MAG: riboflavin synthase [Candidatus Omnitrophica bacterium]|nr:riboflavin synthase [Candidatus Omnitrophota bacterium]MCB9769548.1 riboflavin synthase [Candidatus Omnitrophota bacterium]